MISELCWREPTRVTRGEKCPLNGSYQGLAAWENQTGSPVGWDVGKSTLCIFHTGISLQTWLYQISDKCVITFELITLSTQKMAFCLSLKLVVSPAVANLGFWGGWKCLPQICELCRAMQTSCKKGDHAGGGQSQDFWAMSPQPVQRGLILLSWHRQRWWSWVGWYLS